MSNTRQIIYAVLASVGMIACLAAIAVGASLAHGVSIPSGAHAASPHAITAHVIDHGTVIRDPWCERSEDSCRVNFRRSGAWVIREVTP